jgi:hypothetical protein
MGECHSSRKGAACRSLEDVQSLHELDLDQLRFVSDSLGDLRREVDPQVDAAAVTLLQCVTASRHSRHR